MAQKDSAISSKRPQVFRTLAVTIFTVASLTVAAPAYAQITTGSIEGQVTDQAGQPLPAAGVVAQDVRTGRELRAAADASGRYRLLGLAPGTYTLQGSHAGFGAPSQQVTVLLSSHQLHEVEGVCNRVAVLHRGRKRVEAPVSELFAAEASRIEIRVDRPDEALRLLEGLPWCVQPSRQEAALHARVPRARRGELNALLVKAGFEVSELAERRPSLEDYFYQAISDDE